MGLEAINFFFHSDDAIKEIVESNSEIIHTEGKKYVYKKDDFFWIDIELQNEHSLSIRITLCNPMFDVLDALDRLFLYLFGFENGILNNLNTKEIFKEYNKEVKGKIIGSYHSRKKVFGEMYGDCIAAVSSEEFYKIQRAKQGE